MESPGQIHLGDKSTVRVCLQGSLDKYEIHEAELGPKVIDVSKGDVVAVFKGEATFTPGKIRST